MGLLGVKKRRMLFDSAVIAVSSASAYLAGFLQNLEMGATTFALVLPSIFLIILGFSHLVLRTGRKFDETVHDFRFQFLEAIVFILTMISGYQASLTGAAGLSFFTGVFALFIITSIYLMAYKPNN